MLLHFYWYWTPLEAKLFPGHSAGGFSLIAAARIARGETP